MASKAQEEQDFDSSAQERVRVTDRRRVNVNGESVGSADDPATDTARSLKPSIVEALEARAHAAESKLIEVQARFDQARAQLQRETDELRARLARNADERFLNEKEAFLRALLPVLDNFQRAVEATESGTPTEKLIEGLRGTLQGFEAALAASGAEAVPGVGTKFNPELHEAVDTTTTEDDEDGTVTAEYGRGYRIGNRLLRPARVQVGRAR